MSKKIVTIHQLNYLPWIGLFSKISQSDCFIILDNAQYTSGSVINRNKIRTKNESIYLTIPINRNLHSSLINEVTLPENSNWRKVHWLSIHQNYVRAPFFNRYRGFFEELYQQDNKYLWQLNEKILFYLLDAFNIKVETYKSSELGVDTGLKRTDLLIAYLKKVGADVYLSGQSGKDYLEYHKFERSLLTLNFFNFNHPVYPQRYPGFESNLSAIDLLFNMGPKAAEIIRNAGSVEAVSDFDDNRIPLLP